MGRDLGDRLVAELLDAEELEPRLTPVRLGAYAIAATVHVLTLGLLLGGAALIALTFFNVLALGAGALAIGVAVIMRPRFGKPREDGMLARREAPALHELADEVAEALDVRPPDIIVVDRRFNASWQIVGLRRRRVLTLGLPLVAILDRQERVALAAHELAHARNGDSTRGLFVGSAINGLAECYYILGPEDLSGVREWGELAFFERILNGMMWLVSRPVLGLLMLQLHLVLRDSQRAEFLADALAATVAGTDAAVRLEEKTLLDSIVWRAVQQTAHGSQRGQLFAKLASDTASVPERERERRRRAARLEEARLDETHPPSAHRIQILEGRQRLEPRVVLDAARSAQIDAELAPFHAEAERRLVEEFRDSLYY